MRFGSGYRTTAFGGKAHIDQPLLTNLDLQYTPSCSFVLLFVPFWRPPRCSLGRDPRGIAISLLLFANPLFAGRAAHVRFRAHFGLCSHISPTSGNDP